MMAKGTVEVEGTLPAYGNTEWGIFRIDDDNKLKLEAVYPFEGLHWVEEFFEKYAVSGHYYVVMPVHEKREYKEEE